MNFRAVRSVVISWDWITAAAVAGLLAFTTPREIPLAVAKDIFGISVSILSIVFSVFFAALAVLITAGDNAFVQFLEEKGAYRQIAWTFRFTLLIIFVALMASIGLYVAMALADGSLTTMIMPRTGMVIFAWLALYALFASASAVFDAVRYAEYRVRFIQLTAELPSKKSEH